MAAHSALVVEGFFDSATSTISYLLLDAHTHHCAVIDSVLDYDPKSGRTSTASADKLIARVRALGARVVWLLETHVHADHVSASPYLKAELGGQIAIGQNVTQVQTVFGALFNEGDAFATDGSQFDHLFADGDTFDVGGVHVSVMHTPGHTPACVTYVAKQGDDCVAFVGDTLFMPDYGTARCDFPGGDAKTLFHSIQRVLSLPPKTRLFMCHDYQPAGRAVQFESTVADQIAHNVHIGGDATEHAFVDMRTSRDATLDMPVLILPSVQINMRAGHLPEPEANGIAYLKVPLNAL